MVKIEMLPVRGCPQAVQTSLLQRRAHDMRGLMLTYFTTRTNVFQCLPTTRCFGFFKRSGPHFLKTLPRRKQAGGVSENSFFGYACFDAYKK